MKERFTAALTGSGEGDLLPQMNIVECTVSQQDMSHVKVIESLHKLAGFNESDGWQYKWWTRTLPIKLQKKKNYVGEEYVMTEFHSPYILHADGT
eukprot:2020614-Rhodomonas_salina.1